jgi:hypothetical protein
MNDSLRDAAFRAGVWSVIEAKAKAMKDRAKAELSALEPGDAVSGKWHGQPVAKATMSAGRLKLVVTDEAALLAWVKEHHPTEIVESVNPAFMKTFASCEGQAHWQGHPVDFIRAEQGDPYISVRKADGAEDVIAELFRTGSVGLNGIASAPLPPIVDPAHLDELPVTRWVEEPTDCYTQDKEAAGF